MHGELSGGYGMCIDFICKHMIKWQCLVILAN